MSPEDARFLLDTNPSLAADVARTSIRHGNAMWRVFMNEGLAAHTRASPSSRRDLVGSLSGVESTSDAVELLRHMLDDLKPKQRQTLFSNVVQGSVIAKNWISFVRTRNVGEDGQIEMEPARSDHLLALFATLKEYGIEANAQFKGKGRRGGTYDTSVMRELCADLCFGRNSHPRNRFNEQCVHFLFDLGAKLDGPTKVHALSHPIPQSAQAFVEWFEKKGLATIADFLTEANHKEALSENVALLHSLAAKRAIDQMRFPSVPESKTSVP